MKKIFIALIMALAPGLALAAADAGVELMHMQVDPYNEASLQRGAKLYMNYCSGCHSAKYVRYNRVAEDLGIDEDLVEEYLIFGDQQIGETMTIAMDPDQSEDWFGVTPPDLSLTVRLRGADWVYTYLNTFYADPSKPIGVNNLVFPDVGMPHVLWKLQGVPEPVFEDSASGEPEVVDVRVEEGAGLMTPEEYREATYDLVNFMAYMAEPVRAQRQVLGVKVIVFLLVFLVIAYLLKKEYWKDVH